MDSDQLHILELIGGFRFPMVMFTCLELEVFEALHRNGSLSAKLLAGVIKTHPENTERLLNAAVFCKLLKKNIISNDEATYENSNMTVKYLLKSSWPSLRNCAMLAYRNAYQLLYQLPEAVQTGEQRVAQAHNVQVDNNLYDQNKGFFFNNEKQLIFMGGMDDYSWARAKAVTEAFDLSKFNTTCDLGGGTGALAYALVKKYPHMKITVVDLPSVIQITDPFRPKDDQDYSNVTFQSLDFFVDELPQADLYTLSCVLHDWGDDKINHLLEKLFKTTKPGGAVLIAQKILNEDKTEPEYAVSFDMIMMLASFGRERSFSEYKYLLEKNGFSNVELKITPSISDAILCYKN